jgi:epoxide hydrolase-like predicted phosphatase
MSITTVFFDWGGVIAPDPGDDFLSSLLKRIGATDDQIKEIFETYMSRFTRGQITDQQYWEELRKNYGFVISDSMSDEFRKWRGLVADENIMKLVHDLKKRDIKVALFTNVIEPSYDLIKQAGYYSEFDEVIASCKVGYGKPDQEIYEIALQKMHTTAQESLFIDDKQAFLDPAIRMGFQTILATNSEQIIRDVESLLLGS